MEPETPSATTTDAPSTSAPVDASAPVSTSIDEALEQSFAASLASETTETPDPPVTPEGAAPTTVEPPQEPSVPEGASKKGPIPFDVHDKALQNARTKTEAEVTQRLTQEWQQKVEPILPYAQAIVADLSSGSLDGLTGLLNGYLQHPQLGPQTRSWFGRMLSQQRQAPAAPADTKPEPDLQTGDGSLVYSAAQQQALMDWTERQWQQKLSQALTPYEELRQSEAQRQQQAQHQAVLQQAHQQAQQYAAMKFSKLKDDPDFMAHKGDVLTRMQADATLSIEEAWLQVFRDIVVPKKLAQQTNSYVQTALQKSRGSTTDTVARATAHPRRAQSIDEALDQAFDSVGVS